MVVVAPSHKAAVPPDNDGIDKTDTTFTADAVPQVPVTV
jgi:hypothetical protein